MIDRSASSNVVVASAKHAIVGIYGINMHAINVKDLPASYHKKAGKYGFLPAAFIAMIGVDQTHQGKGVGSVIVADAVYRIARVSEEIGRCVIVFDVFDDGDADTVTR